MALTMEQRLDFEPDPWDPSPGDKVAGEVVAVTEYDDKFNPGATYPVVDLLVDPETLTGVRLYGSRTVLRNELRRLDPQPGDWLGVKYLGRIAGNDYDSYKVAMERRRPPQGPPRLAVVPPGATTGDEPPPPDGPLPDDE
jgi:hypothetical protein